MMMMLEELRGRWLKDEEERGKMQLIQNVKKSIFKDIVWKLGCMQQKGEKSSIKARSVLKYDGYIQLDFLRKVYNLSLNRMSITGIKV